MENLLTIKDAVREVLEESNGARNSDTLLWLLVNRKFGNKIFIEDLKSVINPETVRRCRQHIQNTQGKCPPTEDIDALRNRRQLEFKEVFR
jgi:hypothetical protein